MLYFKCEISELFRHMLKAIRGSVASESVLLTYFEAAFFIYRNTTGVNNSLIQYNRKCNDDNMYIPYRQLNLVEVEGEDPYIVGFSFKPR